MTTTAHPSEAPPFDLETPYWASAADTIGRTVHAELPAFHHLRTTPSAFIAAAAEALWELSRLHDPACDTPQTAYIFTYAKSRTRELLRSLDLYPVRKREASRPKHALTHMSIHDQPTNEPDPTLTVDHDFMRPGSRESFTDLLDAWELDPEQRQYLTLRFFEQLTSSEVAREMGFANPHLADLYGRRLLRYLTTNAPDDHHNLFPNS